MGIFSDYRYRLKLVKTLYKLYYKEIYYHG
jgi:hypothetical protein